MIFLIVAISLLGLLLFALLIRGIKQANEARTLKRHRSKQAGVADLLNYGSMIDDGIILCKNGSLRPPMSIRERTKKAIPNGNRNSTPNSLMPLLRNWAMAG